MKNPKMTNDRIILGPDGDERLCHPRHEPIEHGRVITKCCCSNFRGRLLIDDVVLPQVQTTHQKICESPYRMQIPTNCEKFREQKSLVWRFAQLGRTLHIVHFMPANEQYARRSIRREIAGKRTADRRICGNSTPPILAYALSRIFYQVGCPSGTKIYRNRGLLRKFEQQQMEISFVLVECESRE